MTSILSRLGLLALVAAIAIVPRIARADETDAIRATALDYIDGWYEGDAARMERALHPELVKRIVKIDPKTGSPALENMGASLLVRNVRDGGGTRTPRDQRRNEVKVLDVFGDAAVARIDAGAWIDYLQLHKWKGRWVIVNVLWELKSPPR
ncbi:MAG TPA: nuclear transport factor 2 family protein [Kofleriaceae bacterium]|nr:nuclear transport factor 2 family protein [Kofleriaceae bacterium]